MIQHISKLNVIPNLIFMKEYKLILTLILTFPLAIIAWCNHDEANKLGLELEDAHYKTYDGQLSEAIAIYDDFADAKYENELSIDEYAGLAEKVAIGYLEAFEFQKGCLFASKYLETVSNALEEDDPLTGVAHLYLGAFQARNSQLDSSKFNLDIAMKILSDTKWKSQVYAEIGWYYYFTQDLEKAIYYFSEIVRSFENQSLNKREQWNRARLYDRYSATLIKLGDFSKAEFCLSELDKIAVTYKDPFISFLSNYKHAEYHCNMHQPKLAKKYLDRKRNFHPLMNYFDPGYFFYKAIVEYQLANYPKSIDYFMKVVDLNKKNKSTLIQQADALLWLGEVYALNDDDAKAEETFDTAILYYSSFGDKFNNALADTYSFKGEMFYENEEYSKAKDCFLLASSSYIKNFNGKIGANIYLSRIYLKFFQESNDYIYLDSLFATITGNNSLLEQMRISQRFFEDSGPVEVTANHLYSNNLKLLTALDGAICQDKLVSYSYKYIAGIKAFSLRQKMREQESFRDFNIPNELVDSARMLTDYITGIKKEIYELEQISFCEVDDTKLNTTNEYLADLSLKLEQQINVYNDFVFEIETEYPEFLKYKYGLHSVSIEEIQQNLNPSEVLVEYYIDKTSIYSIAIEKDNVHYFNKDKPDDWETLVGDYVKTSSDYHYQHEDSLDLTFNLLTNSSLKIYDLVLSDVVSVISDKTHYLTIIPDDQLHFIQFDNLLTDAPKKKNDYQDLQYLIYDYTMSRASSAFSFLQLRNESRAMAGFHYVGFAPEYDYDEADIKPSMDSNREEYFRSLITRGSLDNLPFAKESVSVISDLFDGFSFIANKATRSAFLNSYKKGNVVHFAGHSVLDENPDYSQLLFSHEVVDSQLYASDVYDVEMNIDIAVLSACNTGIGKLKDGDGVMSMARAFEFSGCLSLMTSLWTVPDVQTSQLDVQFFKNVDKEMRVDDALRQSKLQLLKNSSLKHSHPFYWSGFFITGKTEPLKKSMFTNFIDGIKSCLGLEV